MKSKKGASKQLTYSKVGVNRALRKASRFSTEQALAKDSKSYAFGSPFLLPFGIIFPSPFSSSHYYDFQIEGVGTKTLLAEISGKYNSIGIDGVAMAANDVLRSGATPLLVSDAIHIAKPGPNQVQGLISGVRSGALIAGCALASGETGNVSEILHSESLNGPTPFDLIVSCLGIAKRHELIVGNIKPGDRVIGLQSSGIHSNGVTLARKVLLKRWGGKFDDWDVPDPLERPLIEELLEPTRIYAKAMNQVRHFAGIRAAVHITGDGFGKFHRLLDWCGRNDFSRKTIGFTFDIKREVPGIFQLIQNSARSMGTPISIVEMFKTFNMGYGFALIVASRSGEKLLDALNKQVQADDIGYVSDDGKISIAIGQARKPMIL